MKVKIYINEIGKVIGVVLPDGELLPEQWEVIQKPTRGTALVN